MKSFRFYRTIVLNKMIEYIYTRTKSKRVNRHIVVFESDDWGSIRMPSLEVRKDLDAKGIKLCSSRCFDLYDTLASNEDLELLIETLLSVKDKNGNPAKITLNTCVANPDFEKIRQSDFTKYYYELFTETLKRYPNHEKSFSFWKEGIKNNVFKPQFHGREHLNYQKWMRYLRLGDYDTMISFNNGVYSNLINNGGQFLEAFYAECNEDYIGMCESVRDGLDLFEKIFGFRSETMIAPCYIWDSDIEKVSSKYGVKYLQSIFVQRHSNFLSPNKEVTSKHYFGEVNAFGQIYLIRNCLFEPSQNPKYGANYCLNRIDKIFELNLPVIISCHRLNFIGDNIAKNRDDNLKNFKYLLNAIIKKYPDVEFCSSDEIFRAWS